jgi:acyl-CoA thioester hydrolase
LTAGESRSQLRVRYAETDQMGIAYHGAYFAWFEVARIELLRNRGIIYRDLEEKQDMRLPVIEARARYLKPTFFDDVLEVRTRVVEVTGARVVFEYTVHRDGDPVLLASGSTSHAAVDSRGRPHRVPEELKRALS